MIADYIDTTIYSPVASGVIAAVADRYVLGRYNLGSNIAFGTAVFIGNLTADSLGHYVLPQSDVKSLEIQVLELGLGAGAVIVADNLVLEPSGSASTFARLSTAIGSRMVADYFRDSVYNTSPLAQN
jgi:hypothetical protein